MFRTFYPLSPFYRFIRVRRYVNGGTLRDNDNDGLLQTDLTVFPYHFTQAEAHGWTYNILMTQAFICWMDFHQTCTDTY